MNTRKPGIPTWQPGVIRHDDRQGRLARARCALIKGGFDDDAGQVDLHAQALAMLAIKRAHQASRHWCSPGKQQHHDVQLRQSVSIDALINPVRMLWHRQNS